MYPQVISQGCLLSKYYWIHVELTPEDKYAPKGDGSVYIKMGVIFTDYIIWNILYNSDSMLSQYALKLIVLQKKTMALMEI